MKKTTIDDVLVFQQKVIKDSDGNLCPIEFDTSLPFKPKRMFFVYGVNNQDEDRGKHAHYKTEQILICLSGEITVYISDGKRSKLVYLIHPGDSVYIPNMIWDEQKYKTEHSVLLSICSTHYDIKDYIHNIDEFKKLKNEL